MRGESIGSRVPNSVRAAATPQPYVAFAAGGRRRVWTTSIFLKETMPARAIRASAKRGSRPRKRRKGSAGLRVTLALRRNLRMMRQIRLLAGAQTTHFRARAGCFGPGTADTCL